MDLYEKLGSADQTFAEKILYWGVKSAPFRGLSIVTELNEDKCWVLPININNLVLDMIAEHAERAKD